MSEQHVLMVGGSAETEIVLRTVLNPRGVGISRVRRGDAADLVRPSVIVTHDRATDSAWPGVPRVVIGGATVGDEHQLSAPFEYPELVAAVDRLLRDSVPVGSA